MTAIKDNYIAALSSSTLAVFELSDMNQKYNEEERNVWLLKGNAMAELLSRLIRERFTADLDEPVKDAIKDLAVVQKKLDKELKLQKDIVATVKAISEVIAVAEQILITAAGLRLA
jgi:hypothetical protein